MRATSSAAIQRLIGAMFAESMGSPSVSETGIGFGGRFSEIYLNHDT